MINIKIDREKYCRKNRELYNIGFQKVFLWNRYNMVWTAKETYESIIITEKIMKMGLIQNSEEVSKNIEKLKETLEINGDKLICKHSFLFPFQKILVEQMLKIYYSRKLGCNLFLEVGIGKTVISLAFIKSTEAAAIILCPKQLIHQWKDEISKFKLFEDEQVLIISGDKTKREHLWNNEGKILIMTYETFREDTKNNLAKGLKDRILVCDEALKIKNADSLIHRTIYDNRNNFRFIINLTGTYISKSLADVFGINRSIDVQNSNQQLFNSQFAVWDNMWVQGRNVHFISKYKNHLMFMDRIKDHTFIMKKEDVKDELPKLIYKDYHYEMDDYQKEIFEHIMASRNLFQNFTLLQMLDNGSEVVLSSQSEIIGTFPAKEKVSQEKINSLSEIIENIGKKQIIIFTHFIKSTELICKELIKNGFDCGVITGDTPTKEMEEKIYKFKSNNLNILVCSDALAQGISFPDVNYLINFDIPLSPAIYEQRIGRINRINSEQNKVIFNLIGGVIEDKVLAILQNKQTIISEIDIKRQILTELLPNQSI